jgi:TolB protein
VAFRERDRAELGLLARVVADDIVERFSGRRGVSSTQIAFVSDNGRRNKEIWFMEADGSGKRRVTNNGSINLFRLVSRRQTLFYLVQSGHVGAVSLYRGNEAGAGPINTKDEVPRCLAGQRQDRGGRRAPGKHRHLRYRATAPDRALTESRAIETSPTFSPDGRRMAFVSDRSGAPQVWIKDLESGEEHRLTFSGVYNSSPAWSPTGEGGSRTRRRPETTSTST